MAGSLDDFPVLERDAPEDYAPGAGRQDERSLADAVILGIACERPLAATVASYGKKWSEEMVPAYAEECAASLGLRDAPEDFDPSAFLQAVIGCASQEMIPESQAGLLSDPSQLVSVDFIEVCGRFYDMLGLLIQTLYHVGYNEFTLDVTPAVARMMNAAPAFRQYPFGEVGRYLLGNQDNPLRLDCTGEFGSFGVGARDCDLTLRGRARYAGSGERSTYRLVDCAVGDVGSGIDCAYYLSTFGPLKELWGSHPPSHNTYHVMSGVTEEDVRTLRRHRFWGPDFSLPLRKRVRNWLMAESAEKEKYNSLFVPDKDGGWKEVTP